MKLGVCCNFSHDHIGGSEAVLKHISERLIKNYSYEIDVYSFSVKSPFCDNGVKYFPCKKGEDFISQINKMSHLFVYSTDFWQFDTIVKNIEKINPDVSVALVGAYYIQSHPEILSLLKKNIDRFSLITHSSITPDYKWCVDNSLDVNVIPNGVDLQEFDNSINFREKYGIKSKYVFLNVSNYFFGKGQEILGRINEKQKINSIFVSISNTISYPYDKTFLRKAELSFKRGCSKLFLRDIPREDVIAAFKCSDVFLFTSRKEVSSLVILESQTAGLPWISMDVGDVVNRKGGVIVNNTNEDDKGYKIVDDKIIDDFVFGIECIISGNSMVTGESVKKKLVREGQKDIKKYDWEKIVPLYDGVFKK